MIPLSTQQVISGSDFYIEPDIFYYVAALDVKTPELHRLICRDDKEITVVTTEAGLTDLTIQSQNQEQWRLLVINCANPFYCVGFLQSISSAMTAAGLDILLISTFSRDYVFVAQHHLAQAVVILQNIGFVKQERQNQSFSLAGK
ncbi:ACT domain-containing protein [Rheinheimera sp.]|uniref:ACT domain-containing protein n=1 Tax=Rheinheimera sp. TaxID=1869214 RepID=UPI0027BA9024|nr:ACT domain-containing protein [Rheinheimera sp.]